MAITFRTYRYLFLIAFCLASFFGNAQSVEIKTDKNQILIGERIEYNMTISLPTNGYSIDFNLPDTIAHFETIETGKFDSLSNNGTFTINRKFIFTSFDSGSWYIPSLPLTLGINDQTKKYYTDSVLINVGYAAADSTNELRDIKPIIEVKLKNYFWYYVLGICLLVLLIGFLIYHYILKRKRKPLPVLYSNLSPYDEAMVAIKELAKYNLNTFPEIKKFHSEISFIFKRYFSRNADLNLLNKTTGELLLQLKQNQVSADLLTSIAQTLRIGDAVKFAKYVPGNIESENCAHELKQAIENLEKNKQIKN